MGRVAKALGLDAGRELEPTELLTHAAGLVGSARKTALAFAESESLGSPLGLRAALAADRLAVLQGRIEKEAKAIVGITNPHQEEDDGAGNDE